jgi:UDP-glucose 4-epimerase
MEQLKAFYSKKKILVTGGAGFIGSHLVEKLIELEADVTVLDNFSSGRLSNLQNVLTKITLLYADIRSAESTFKATLHKDIVFHLASFVSVPESIKNPELCIATNTQGTRNLLESCKKNDVNNLIFSSSSAVYGDKNGQCKEDDTVQPKSPYAQSKLDGEALCKEFAVKHGINTACLRYFNVYGDRQSPNGDYAAVVAKFKHQLLHNKPITIFGDGKQTRDFIDVKHVVDANIKIGMLNNQPGEIFNIGSGKSINLFELLDLLEKELHVKPQEITFQPARQGDIVFSQASCDKYQNLNP